MIAALSPYHLTTREPAAMAALLLAERVVTMVPTPFDGAERSHVERAVSRSPRYLDLMESWRWSVPLWSAGVITGDAEGDDAADEVRTVCARLRDDEHLAPLRLLMRESLFDDERSYLDAIARDLLRAGPDPAISIPVAAAMDRFAALRGMVVMRSFPTSVAQRAEHGMAEKRFAFAMPLLIQASGERLLEAREALGSSLTDLGRTVRAAAFGEASALDVADAARDAARAFEPLHADLARPCEDEDDLHVIIGTASVTAVTLPVDAVLDSSLAAFNSFAQTPVRTTSEPSSLPALRDPLAGERVVSLVVRSMGRRR
ncbi:MAG: hypothetical protein AMXMBFR77_03650 [Phycisphaerales bacterium]|nr:hypothetical protein [Phycisphaerales bacterium]MDL1904176.1 hypothetical protein [Synechococcales cyanobacterium CNB]GIK19134.1 MAG: hypothetical protein BroJett004_12980 [Planctomycetota bacterium]